MEAWDDEEFQAELLGACSEDLLFFVNVFLWTYNPKEHPTCPVIPFVTWDYQKDAFLKMADAIGERDMLIEKSRDMGASWMCIIVFFWRWLFYPEQTFLLVSRVEELVDKKNDPDCLMWKLDFMIKHLPLWMVPNYDRKKLSLANKENGSSIIGSSTTSETSRGGRRTALLFDEFAAVDNGYGMLSASRDNTRCRFFNSTPQGTGNAFYRLCVKLPVEQKIRLHWSEHPEKALGLYFSQNAKLNMVNGDALPEGYVPIMDGRVRSPWYDRECSRAVSDQEIAQELDIDYHRSGWQFFSDEVLMRLKPQVRPPIYVGMVIGERGNNKPEFHRADTGGLKVWCNLIDGVRPYKRNYTIGCDIATGTGGPKGSRSAASVVEILTGEKVAEYLTNQRSPSEFAEDVLQLCYWFNTAFLVWEDNGPGGEFRKVVVDSGYRHMFFRGNEDSIVIRKGRHQTLPGWWSQTKTKRVLLSDYGVALRTGAFINHSGEALEECRQYVHKPTGDIVHSAAANAYDPTQSGENHGDIVIADALAWRGCKDKRPNIEDKKMEIEIPINSYAGRKEARERADSGSQFGWFSTPSMVGEEIY